MGAQRYPGFEKRKTTPLWGTLTYVKNGIRICRVKVEQTQFFTGSRPHNSGLTLLTTLEATVRRVGDCFTEQTLRRTHPILEGQAPEDAAAPVRTLLQGLVGSHVDQAIPHAGPGPVQVTGDGTG